MQQLNLQLFESAQDDLAEDFLNRTVKNCETKMQFNGWICAWPNLP